MKIKKKLVLMICFLIVSAELTAVTYAAEGSVSIPVQYNVSKDSKYRNSVEVIGPGTVYDGTAKIIQGTVVYELSVEQEKIFKLVPNKGSNLKSVTWNDEDIRNKLVEVNGGYMIGISGISIDSKLRIEFTSNDQPNNPDNEGDINGDDLDKLPNTGYDENINSLILLSILGLIAIVIGSRKEFKQK
ncbi:LPXTG cell wall anchor domain-containing protein [Clostridium sardiniense]|uniref:LPXTG cell wall anchor domain-containing protein n=1 Tax=Clostridium sardiniense TaxID=29369 RepID=A0ABS7L2B3_CLOSR|nr:LPXTG cell wall anchor domain-containing protein [Clostridium sardiniense]MBY0757209.1 LPXTG cell wall anchor domain-containing protein [Clostridium sardiniense]MDQ0462056.1 LPXTG-motif cell wall-anchored protein [Clostridium sardiniense]